MSLHHFASVFSRKGDVAPTGQEFSRTQLDSFDSNVAESSGEAADGEVITQQQRDHLNLLHDWFSGDRPKYLWDSIVKISTEGILYLNLPSHVLGERQQPHQSQHLYRRTFVQHGPPPQRLVSHVPRLDIVMLVVGTRGDVQPFIGIGLKLKAFGHRVRLASHAVYRDFVETYGLEFYPLGGNPKVLSEYVVKHRGLMPTPSWNLAKEVAEQSEQLRDIIFSTWPACTEPDPEHPDKPFKAQLIISNPVTYGHIHCAEKLQVPLHIVFTMPWTPTVEFPSPWCRVGVIQGQKDRIAGNGHEYTFEFLQARISSNSNWTSYFFTEYVQWAGVRHIIAQFRSQTLGLKDWLHGRYASALNYAHNVRFTYIWSPSLVPRPKDWDPVRVRVVGFVDVKLGAIDNFQPPQNVVDFLNQGPPPIYIGFGSLVFGRPEKLTRWFINAIDDLGLRAIVQKGWGGLGASLNPEAHPNILIIEAMPHDWLFPRCRAVIHHGGAGTTACGLMNGKPTFIVPFFGDQPFWGDAVHAAGVGPAPVSIGSLSVNKIKNAIKCLLDPEVSEKALELQQKMSKEDGAAGAMASIHDHLLDTMNSRARELELAHQPSMEDRFESLLENSAVDLRDYLLLQPNPSESPSDHVRATPVTEATLPSHRQLDTINGAVDVNVNGAVKSTGRRLKGGVPKGVKSPPGSIVPRSPPGSIVPLSPPGANSSSTDTSAGVLSGELHAADVERPKDVTSVGLSSEQAGNHSSRSHSSPEVGSSNRTSTGLGSHRAVPVVPPELGGQTREFHLDSIEDEEPAPSLRHPSDAEVDGTIHRGDVAVDGVTARETYVPSRINPVTGIPSYINTSYMGPALSPPDTTNATDTTPTHPQPDVCTHAATAPAGTLADATLGHSPTIAKPSPPRLGESLPAAVVPESSKWERMRSFVKYGPDHGARARRGTRRIDPARMDSERLKTVLLSGQAMTYEEPFWARWAKFKCCTTPPQADEFGIVHTHKEIRKLKQDGAADEVKRTSTKASTRSTSDHASEQSPPLVPRPASTLCSPFAAPNVQHGWDDAISSSSQQDSFHKPFHPSSVERYSAHSSSNTNSSGTRTATGSNPTAAVSDSNPRSSDKQPDMGVKSTAGAVIELNSHASDTKPTVGWKPTGGITEVVGGAAVGTVIGAAAAAVHPTTVPQIRGITEANADSGTDRTKGSAKGSGRRQWDLREPEKKTDGGGGGSSILDTDSSLELYLMGPSNGAGAGVFAPQGIMKDGCTAPPSIPLTATEEIFLTNQSDYTIGPDEPSAPLPSRDVTRASTGNPLGKAVTPEKLGSRESDYAEPGQTPLHPALASVGSSASDADLTKDQQPTSARLAASRIPKRPSDLEDRLSSKHRSTKSTPESKTKASPHRTKSGPKSPGSGGRKPWTPVGGPSRVGRGDKFDRDDDGLLDIAAHVMRPMEG